MKTYEDKNEISQSSKDQTKNPIFGLLTSLKKEHQYDCKVEGKIPEGLRGSLYRNGPGLFERSGVRKESALDGDGMIQSYEFKENKVQYLNRFVRTKKFKEEETSGQYEYATWTSRKPGSRFKKMFSLPENQAGVSVSHKNNKLYAFDESSMPYELNPHDLTTKSLSTLGQIEDQQTVFSAHSKTDGENGDWLHFGLKYGPKLMIHLTCLDKDGNIKFKRKIKSPRNVYMHDWFVTKNYLILHLHPSYVNLPSFILGKKSLAQSFEWKPEKGTLLMILKRDGSGEPVFLKTKSSWMWHSINAYEDNEKIICDFVGYDTPDHFIGDDPYLYAVMEKRLSKFEQKGKIYRHTLDLLINKVETHSLAIKGDFEFPVTHPKVQARSYRYTYLNNREEGGFFGSKISRVDMIEKTCENFDFGADKICMEPIFVPKPKTTDNLAEKEKYG